MFGRDPDRALDACAGALRAAAAAPPIWSKVLRVMESTLLIPKDTRFGGRGSHDDSTVRPWDSSEVRRSSGGRDPPRMFARAVAGRAAFAQHGGVGEGVGSGRHVVVAALAGGGDRRRGLREAARTGYHRFGPDVLHEIRVAHVAGAAIPQVAREQDFLVIGGSQNVRVGQVLAAVDAVDLPGEVHALARGAVRQGRIVAERALLGGVARAAVNEAQVHMASRALGGGYDLTPRCDGALVYREIELHRLGRVSGGNCGHRARKQGDRIACFDGHGIGTHRAGRDLIGHGVGVGAIGARRLAGIFGNADGARTGLVIGVGTGQNHPDRGELADVDRNVGLVRHAERDRGRVTGSRSIDLQYLGDEAGERRGVRGDEVRAGDRGIEIHGGRSRCGSSCTGCRWAAAG